ncbi:MAG: sigma-54 dependent transcriptional regulator [Gammaproteobacteria bacterium]|nr:sigma-54 dependent transcriptional regulator [Gammaproteobacteria bacterium]
MKEGDQIPFATAAEQLFSQEDCGFALIDSDHRVAMARGRAADWIKPGTLVEESIPFLVGYEDVLERIGEGKLESFSLPYIAFGEADAAPPRTFSLLLCPSGKPGWIGAVLRDETEKFRFERDLLQKNNELALAEREASRLNEIIRNYEDEVGRRRFQGFVGGSLQMQAVYRIVESAATSDATVLIMGESGTGKEVCAEAIHSLSHRKEGPFITVNCAAIPSELIESELFGHVKGAFTGATATRKGAAALAHRGTLFLDEICEMDVALQAKLLRFLQSRKIQMVGKSELEDVDARILSATNRDVLGAVKAGRFREDLYYRLNVIPVSLPPLRERGNDVIELAETFLAEISKKEGKRFLGIADDARRLILKYPWPGNVRELQNIIQRIVVLNDGGEVTAGMLSAIRIGAENSQSKDPVANREFVRQTETLPQSSNAATRNVQPLSQVERQAIERAVELSQGNVRLAASRLGVAPATIYRKLAGWKKSNLSKS